MIPSLSITLDEAVSEWQKIKAWQAVAKDRELLLRNAIAEAAFTKESNGAFREGTQNNTVETDGAVFKVKLVGKYNYKVDEEKAKEVCSDLPSGLVKWKPELSLSIYRNLLPEQQKLADHMLEIKPGSIELEVTVLPK